MAMNPIPPVKDGLRATKIIAVLLVKNQTFYFMIALPQAALPAAQSLIGLIIGPMLSP